MSKYLKEYSIESLECLKKFLETTGIKMCKEEKETFMAAFDLGYKQCGKDVTNLMEKYYSES